MGTLAKLLKTIRAAYFVTAVIFTSSSYATQCSHELENLSTNRKYEVVDRKFPELLSYAKVESGYLSFSLKMKGLNGRRSPLLRGKDEFAKILHHFQGRFSVIVGYWVINDGYSYSKFDGTDPNVVSDNLARFNQLVREGFSLEDAAKQTWTGQQALAQGYTEVKISCTRGTAGNYFLVVAHFSRPGEKLKASSPPN